MEQVTGEDIQANGGGAAMLNNREENGKKERNEKSEGFISVNAV